MTEFYRAPAQTYQLNTVASALGRFAIPVMDVSTAIQARQLTDNAIEDMSDNPSPAVPHNGETLLQEAILFDNRLKAQIENGPAAESVTKVQKTALVSIVEKHRRECARILAGRGERIKFVEDSSISEAFGLPELWSNPEDEINSEITQWGRATSHPEVLPILRKKVSAEQTKKLLQLSWEEVVGIGRVDDVNVHLIKNASNFHLYWAPKASGTDYATPDNYDKATQLSFDIPHNAAHLAHLTLMNNNKGVQRYDDSMPIRAFFESVAVLSEYKMLEILDRPQFLASLAEIFGIGDQAVNQLVEWISADRKYEFKLRATRYAADVLLLEGVPHDEAIDELSKKFGIPLQDAEKELRKYAAWPGLGALYTHGYKKLLNIMGSKSIAEILKPEDAETPTSWRGFVGPDAE